LIKAQQNRFGKDARAAISYKSEHRTSTPPTAAKTLYEDIINIPRHVFGDHTRCKDYFCKQRVDNVFEAVE